MEKLINDAIEELMQKDDGVNPNSPIPVEQQLNSKRAEYRKQLELIPLQAKIKKAIELIESEMTKHLSEDERELILSELADAGEILAISPDMQGEDLGISLETFNKLFAFAEAKLETDHFENAAAILTLLSILGSNWFRHWFFLGVALQELKEYKEAISAYEKANAITDADPLAYLFMAECFADLLDKQQAALHLEKAKNIIQGLPENSDWLRLVNELEHRIKG